MVANCLCALQEIYLAEASRSDGSLKDRDSLYLKDFSEWAQCLVLDVVSKYVSSNLEESFKMMDILEDRLQHANSAVVLATIKVFLHLTLSMADIHQQVTLHSSFPNYCQTHLEGLKM